MLLSDQGNGLPVEAEPCSDIEPVKPPKARRLAPVLLALMLAVAVVVAGAGAFSLVGSPRTGAAQVFRLSDELAKWLGTSARTEQTAGSQGASATQQAVTALGRIEPEGEVIKLSVPAFLKDERVANILVRQGDRVKAGQAVCTLESVRRLDALLREALEQVRIAQAKLARVKAGARQGELQAQKATTASLEFELKHKLHCQGALVARLKADMKFQQREHDRYSCLYADGAVSASMLDSKQLALSAARCLLDEALAEGERIRETLSARIEESRATLDKIAEVRSVDVSLAQTEVDESLARVNKIKTDLQLACVRAPRDGRILKIQVRPGEAVTDRGIADIGQTDRMVVVAEVHQSDMSKVRLGQPASIAGDGFEGQLHGSVYQLGWQVIRQNVFAQDPGASNDRRVVEVKVLVDRHDSSRVAGLTNMQVVVSIGLSQS